MAYHINNEIISISKHLQKKPQNKQNKQTNKNKKNTHNLLWVMYKFPSAIINTFIIPLNFQLKGNI